MIIANDNEMTNQDKVWGRGMEGGGLDQTWPNFVGSIICKVKFKQMLEALVINNDF